MVTKYKGVSIGDCKNYVSREELRQPVVVPVLV